MLRSLFVVAGLVAIGLVYDDFGPQTCSYVYDTTLNGLYLIKTRKCVGPLGMTTRTTELGRKPLFIEF